MKKLLIPILVLFGLPNGLISESLKDNYYVPYRDSKEYTFRKEIGETCTVQKSNYKEVIYQDVLDMNWQAKYQRGYYCVTPDGTVAYIYRWLPDFPKIDEYASPSASFRGVIDKSISHNGVSKVEYSIEENNLVKYVCYKLIYSYDPEGQCVRKDIRRRVVGTPK